MSTPNEMNDYDLAQRMGQDATDEQAQRMRRDLVARDLGDVDTEQIDDGEWLDCMNVALAEGGE